MTGLPNFNEHAFNVAAATLREAGWFVYNPVENDEEAGIVLDGLTGHEEFDFKTAMKRDLFQVCDSEVVFVLPGWEISKGAGIETHVAWEVGVEVRDIVSGDRILSPAAYADLATIGIPPKAEPKHTLPTESQARKDLPVTTGVFDYFPAALAAVAAVSKAGNDKHNPGQPLHWARSKSMDQADAIGRHLLERGGIDPDNGLRHSAQLAWRSLALLQIELETAGEAPLSRGSAE